MIPKQNRITRSLLKTIQTKGIFLNSDYVSVYIYKNEGFSSKFAFSCSKKNIKSAVKRNLIRRRGYSVINKNLDKIKEGFIFMFSFKKGAGDQSYSILERDIVYLLKNFVK